MRLSGKSVGLLMSFYLAHLRDAMKRNGRRKELATIKCLSSPLLSSPLLSSPLLSSPLLCG
jgi:hypothetical protein